MRDQILRLVSVGVLLGTQCLASRVAAQGTRRPLHVEDVIAMQDIRQVVISPDGKTLAVVIKRAGGPTTTGPDAHTDIWLLAREGGTPRNLTIGVTRNIRWWSPAWSPDGRRLAMLAGTPQGDVTPYIWDRQSNTLAQVIDREVNDQTGTDSTWPSQPLAWIDSVTMLCPVLAKGMKPGYRAGSETWTQYAAPREWEKTSLGIEPAVSVLESGREIPLNERPQGELLAIDVRSGRTRTVAAGNFWQIILSPTRRYAALIADAGHIAPTQDRRVPWREHTYDLERTRLGIVRLDSTVGVRWSTSIYDPVMPVGTLPTIHSWSPDGKTLAVVAKDDPKEAYATTAYTIAAATGETKRMTDRTWEIRRTRWASNDTELVLGRRTSFANPGTDTMSTSWWAIDPSAGNLNPSAPESLSAPTPDWATSLMAPSPAAQIAAVDSAHRLLVYTAAERTGTYLWIGDGYTHIVQQRIALNEALRAISDARQMLIHYVGADGDSLGGLLVLPLNYTPGQRYPLIVWVYGGTMVRDTGGFADKQDLSPLNLALLPAHGYALLVPSMPLAPDSVASDPMIDMSKGVMSAIDEAVRLRVADPTRIGLMGQSYGGYSTYSLITYGHRFRAAVALAGMSDLVSFYSEFDPRRRYSAFGYEEGWALGWSESGQGRMGNSPWGNLSRYIRNSPLYLADRVETPLMIIQGDADAVPMQQGEAFFTALYRMGKRAKFVRYWGEGHVIYKSPANLRDLWQRIFGWFDQELDVQPPSQANAVGQVRVSQ